MSLPDAKGDIDQVRRGLDRVMRLLDRLRLGSITFFVTGHVASHLGSRLADLSRAGHEIGCHSLNHDDVASLGPSAFKEDVRRATSVIQEATGEPVVGFRAPNFSAGAEVAWYRALLAAEGYVYDSSMVSGEARSGRSPCDVVDTDAGVLLEFPVYRATMLGAVGVRVIGGTFLRFLPTFVVRRLMQDAIDDGYVPAIYIHVADLDPDLRWIRYSEMGSMPSADRLAWLMRQNLWTRNNASVPDKVARLCVEFDHLGSYRSLAAAHRVEDI